MKYPIEQSRFTAPVVLRTYAMIPLQIEALTMSWHARHWSWRSSKGKLFTGHELIFTFTGGPLGTHTITCPGLLWKPAIARATAHWEGYIALSLDHYGYPEN